MIVQKFGGVETIRFVPRGVEVNGKEYVPVHELKNCQEARERAVRAHTEAWAKIKKLREDILSYANHEPLDLLSPAEIQRGLLALGQEHTP